MGAKTDTGAKMGSGAIRPLLRANVAQPMTCYKIEEIRDEFPLVSVLTALQPLLVDSLFYVAEYMPGWWTSPEAQAWATLLLEPTTIILPGAEPVLLSFANAVVFARSSVGMGDYILTLIDRPSDLQTSVWAGYLSEYQDFEVGFEDELRASTAEKLLPGRRLPPSGIRSRADR